LPGGFAPAEQQAVARQHLLRGRVVWGVLGPVATSAGIVDLLVLQAGREDAAVRPLDFGPLVAGMEPGAGEVVVPRELAERAGIGPGDSLVLIPVRSGLGDGGVRRLPPAAKVVGVYEPASPWLSGPLLMLGEGDFAAAGRPIVAFGWLASAGSLGRFVAWAQQNLTPAAVAAPYRADRPVVSLVAHAGLPQAMARQMQQAMYFPGGEAMFMLYAFFGAGAFTLMLLAFMDRRRELAVMKTLGLTSRQVALVLYLEALVVALAGLAFGLAAMLFGVGPLRQITGQDYRVPAWIAASGSGLGIIALALSVWLPIGMARLATVANLLGGQPFRPAGYERRWGGDDNHGSGVTAAEYSRPGHPRRQGRSR
jgi:predicted lysophospholipase L1 biosynthesis ABC-type transport system permease subunit